MKVYHEFESRPLRQKIFIKLLNTKSMGATWSQQGCLRISPDQGLVAREDLQVGKEYPFKKTTHRLYSLDVPMVLFTRKWQAIASVIITEITVGHNITKGIYKVLKVYSDEEVRIVSQTTIPYEGSSIE
jgi:hypothetical protein